MQSFRRFSSRLVEPLIRNRLEEHYYNTCLQDILVLSYDHEQAMKVDLTRPEFNPSLPERPMETLFTTDIDSLASRPELGNQFLLSTEAQLRTRQKVRWQKKLKNPIDYTSIKKEEWLAPVVDNTRAPFAPLPDRLVALKKVTLRIWCEEAAANKSLVLSAVMALQSITGKRPEPVIAEKGDSSKKIRQGMPMGATVTLQGKDMFLFVDKMTQCVLPRISDWKGVHPRGGDNGSLTLELSAAAIGYFPDIEPHFDMFPRLFDTTVVFETTGSTDLEAQMLLSAFQIPIMQESDIEKEPEAAPEEDDKYAQIKLAKTRVERQALAAELARDAKKEK